MSRCFCVGGHPTAAAEDAQRRIRRLAEYNTEVSRGILHTQEYNDLMKREQEEFDANGPEGMREIAKERRYG